MQKELFIDGKRVASDTDCFLIAEIGHNHQGCPKKCLALFDAAKKAGASAVKLQKRDNKSLFTRRCFNEPYISQNAYGPTYGLHREALELNVTDLRELKDYAKEIGITFFATPFDIPSANIMRDLDMPVFKIASGDVKNHPLIDHIARFHKPIILSTGGATMEDVKEAVEIISRHHSQLAILQCTAAYPPKDEELNLSVIKTYAYSFPNTVIGYSGHDVGTTMSLASFAIGARIIEKHFTLDKNLPGNDHKLSLTPEEFSFLAQELKKLSVALGDGIKCIYDSERPAIKKMSKKLVASRDLPPGHIISIEDLSVKSPGDGLAPSLLHDIIGRKLKQQLVEEESLMLQHLE